jgi:hypothetical protein
MQIRVTIINSPGMSMTHQEFVSSARCDKLSILPQDTSSTGSPSPKKLNVDSMRIVDPILEMIINRIAGRKFGNK